MNDYPENWDELANHRKMQEGYRCERCKHSNSPSTGHTLTVHHLDGNKANCKDSNLAVLCQRCHLHVQAMYYISEPCFPWGPDESWLKKHRLT